MIYFLHLDFLNNINNNIIILFWMHRSISVWSVFLFERSFKLITIIRKLYIYIHRQEEKFYNSF